MNVLEGETWDPQTWNWNPQCPLGPQDIKIMINATNITNATSQLVSPACTGYCAGFLYPLAWQIDEIRDVIYPIFLYIFGILYTFFAIAIICDEFFVPALERIADKYDISPDVAGATLMAAGGSAPELATSSIGTFNESPVGFGTIVGSAVFNVLFVIGACAFAAPSELKLDWWPLFRDCSYYCFSLGVMAVFFGYISPSRIYWYEALSLFSLYIVYVLIMSRNKQLEEGVNGCVQKCRRKKTVPAGTVSAEIAVHPAPETAKSSDQATKDEDGIDKKPLVANIEKEEGGSDGEGDDDDEDDEGPMEIVWPKAEAFEHHNKCPACQLFTARIFFVLVFPLKLIFFITVPDVRREDGKLCGRTVHWKECWLPAFALSIGWIVVFSYMMVWWAEILGKVSRIHPTVIGLTLLAAGTSIPDLVSSVLVARKGEGNMAVSSSIGSNIFDILICLPLPWLTYSIMNGVKKWGDCTEDGDNHVCFSVGVYAETLLFSVMLLVVMIFIVIMIVHCSGWKMTKSLGISMLVLYFLFVLQDVLRNCEMFPQIGRWFTWLRSNTDI